MRTHTSPVQVRTMLSQEPPIYVVVPGKDLPAGLGPDPHADVPPDRKGLAVDKGITLAHLKGTLAVVGPLRVRRGSRRSLEAGILSVYRTERGVGRKLLCMRRRRTCGARSCKGSGWLEMLGAGMVDPAGARRGRLRSGKVYGFRLRDGSRPDGDGQVWHPGLADVLRGRPPFPEPVLISREVDFCAFL